MEIYILNFYQHGPGLKIAQFVRTLYSVGAKKPPFVRSRLSKIRTYGLSLERGKKLRNIYVGMGS